jgi:hypothetical protein
LKSNLTANLISCDKNNEGVLKSSFNQMSSNKNKVWPQSSQNLNSEKIQPTLTQQIR